MRVAAIRKRQLFTTPKDIQQLQAGFDLKAGKFRGRHNERRTGPVAGGNSGAKTCSSHSRHARQPGFDERIPFERIRSARSGNADGRADAVARDVPVQHSELTLSPATDSSSRLAREMSRAWSTPVSRRSDKASSRTCCASSTGVP